MKRLAAIGSVILFCSALSQAAAAPPAAKPAPVPTIAAGTPYALARAALLRAHAMPNTAGARSIGCTMESDICHVYPELEACSQGAHFCRFEWLAADGRHFAVITVGEEVGGLTVQ